MSMASGLVKWWRAKFLGGYKQITVLPECGATDTEELVLQRAPSACSAPPDLLPRGEALGVTESPLRPPRAPASCGNTPDKTAGPDPDRVHFEEFTCDVSVEGGDTGASGTAQPLQFSFTLYDLDGHGRITKDDIAGIVSTIYESVGKSVVVPHYGSKTIKVRLTVAPEQKPQSKESATPPNDNRKREPPFSRRKPRRRKAAPPPVHSDPASEEDRCSAAGDEDLTDSDTPRRRRRQYPKRQTRRECFVTDKPEGRGRSLSAGGQGCWRRSGSLQRRELLEIIQASMEKNNLCFQPNRKPMPDDLPTKRHRNRAHTISKLAQHDQDTKFCRYDSFLHAVICSQQQHTQTGIHNPTYQQSATQTPPRLPQRSRSHELNQAHPAIRYTLLEPTDVSQCKTEIRRPLPKVGKTTSHTCSPHHLKHHNREKYHARAMAQVEKWLENDNSTRLAARAKKVNVDPVDSQECEGLLKTTDKINESLEDKPPSPGSSTVHRYVHEHIHHHYHHFEEDAASTAAI